MDAIAAPFVQGALSKQSLSASIETRCAESGRELSLRVGSDLTISVDQPEARPLLFHPQVDWTTFEEPNIIHGF